MSDSRKQLLNRPKTIERSKQIEPNSSFARNSIFTANEEKNTERNVKKAIEKTTTARVSYRNKDRINALVALKGLDSVDELLDVLLDEHESVLTTDEKRELRTMVSIYEKKRSR
ncbi:hypothetical protein [Listeria immobilis]|uniref:hypothetical protein n=1 Tax=Listeria immobilis TaxID=2713502 RepID=UPI001624466B|nr:hypothetical protein [Listeria immobilis]MBC1517168.1 hypothetical protein [Listeria immobilis]MBC6298312.1 hypothetical protein [Listeria immobilis]